MVLFRRYAVFAFERPEKVRVVVEPAFCADFGNRNVVFDEFFGLQQPFFQNVLVQSAVCFLFEKPCNVKFVEKYVFGYVV